MDDLMLVVEGLAGAVCSWRYGAIVAFESRCKEQKAGFRRKVIVVQQEEIELYTYQQSDDSKLTGSVIIMSIQNCVMAP
jgi:hypothetical protein